MDRRQFVQAGTLATLCGFSGFSQDRKLSQSPVLAVTSGHLRLYEFSDGKIRQVWETLAPQDPRLAYLSPAIADVDRDGENELLAMRSDRLTIWKGRNLASYVLPMPESMGFPALTVGDANGDGIAEIVAARIGVVADRREARIGVYRFDGKEFDTIVPPTTFPYLDAVCEICLCDANQDGKQELVVGGRSFGPNDDAYLYVLGLEKDRLVEQARIPTRTNISTSVKSADFDNDGTKELVISGSTISNKKPIFEGVIAWRYNKRTGTYDQTAESPTERNSPEAMDIGDVDNDGKNELVYATSGARSRGEGPIRELMKANQYLFVTRHERGTLQTLYSEHTGVMAHFGGIAIGDLDKDGKNEFSLQGTAIYKHTNGRYERTLNPNPNYQSYCTIGDLPI